MAVASPRVRRQDSRHAHHPATRITDCFVDLVDPRIDRTKRHQLLDIVTIAVCAVIGGADSWVEVAEWGRIKRDWLTEWLELPHGIPSHDTFGRVFARIDPNQFTTGFLRWVQAVVATAPPEEPASSVIAIDGKTLRRSGDRRRGQAPLHLVSAWATAQHLVLAQEAVADKANEITTIPTILDQLDLRGQIVTIDAMGCQRAIAQQIVGGGGDYVLALKANQPDLRTNVVDTFALAATTVRNQTIEKNHGRLEIRVCDTITDPAVIAWINPAGAWSGLQSIARVTATRQVTGQAPTTTVRYYLSSLSGDARQIAHAVRSHWGIENGLHWVLDIGFREDESRVRTGAAQENLAVLRKLALAIIQHDPIRKVGVAASRKKAGWDTDFLRYLLTTS